MMYLDYYSESEDKISYEFRSCWSINVPYFATLSNIMRNIDYGDDYDKSEAVARVLTDLVLSCKKLDDRIKELEGKKDVL